MYSIPKTTYSLRKRKQETSPLVSSERTAVQHLCSLLRLCFFELL